MNDLVKALRLHAFDDCGERELATHIANLAADEIERLIHDLERQMDIAQEYVNEVEHIKGGGEYLCSCGIMKKCAHHDYFGAF